MDWETRLLERLVALDTDAMRKSNYSECTSLIAREAEAFGLGVRAFDAFAHAKDGKPRPNLVIDLDAGMRQTLLLATHYDTVPAGLGWKYDPLKLTITNGKAYGRGAADDKGGIVAALSALKDLRRTGDSRVNVRLLVTCDEEVGGELGLGFLVGRHIISGDAAVVVDSDPELALGASGVVFGKIIVKGKQGHAGYPHLAKNAIQCALPLLADMERFAKVRERKHSVFLAHKGSPHSHVWGRFTLTMLQAGEKENIIPGELEARFDMRLLPEEDPGTAIEELKEYFTKVKMKDQVDARLEITAKHTGYYTPPENRFVRNFSRIFAHEPVAMLGGNDGRFFARRGIPVISFGPARTECNVHGRNEFVYLEDLEHVKHVLYNLCANWEAI